MTALEVTDVSVRFGGRMALHDVDLHAEGGTITGLIGPNGAGKTTLFNVISGLQPPTRGQVALGGTDVTRLPPFKRARQGLARTFQRLELFGLLTVRENVRLAADVARRSDPDRAADELLARLDLAEVADQRADRLPTGQARVVELVRALATKPSVLLLDEPASGQNEQETAAFAAVMREVAADGVAVVLVEHDVHLVMEVCSVVYVLDLGRVLASGPPATVQQNDAVRAAYLGELARVTEPLLSVRGLRAAYGSIEVLHGIDLDVPTGSVLAILGPNGAGKSTLLSVLAGLHPATTGSIVLAGRRVNGARADDLARAGLCLIPEGRGVFPNLTVHEHLRMATHSGRSLRDIEQETYGRFPRLAERRTQMAGTLSGGEQQMLALARGLAAHPTLLMLDELSMGLAPLIVEELYAQVAAIAATGVAIVVVEQFARTVLGVADLAAVLVHGRIDAIGAPADIEGDLSQAYLGATAAAADLP